MPLIVAEAIETEDAPASVRTDSEGRFELRGVASEVPIQVVASAPMSEEARSDPFELGPDETRAGVELELAAAGAIEVSLTDGAGAPRGSALAEVRFLGDGEDTGPRTEFLPPTGRATFDGLRPGPWEVRIELFGEDAPEGPRETVEVRAGERTEVPLVGP